MGDELSASELHRSLRSVRGTSRLARHFYLAMALGIAVVVAAAFGRQVVGYALHAPSPRPFVLYLHVGLSTLWVLLFVSQAALVNMRRVAWHRIVGWFGFALGVLVPIVGIGTALAMTRFHIAQGNPDHSVSLIVPFFEMLAFAVTFGLAIYWRARPEYHRRLMLMATCVLAMAAFPQLPDWIKPMNSWYGAVALILAGATRDWLAMRRIHPVYLYGLPALVLGQTTAIWIYKNSVPAWVAIVHALLRWT